MAYGGSASDRLAAVQAAIDRCLYSQEYRVGSRATTYATLASLRILEERLLNEVARENNSEPVMQLGQLERL